MREQTRWVVNTINSLHYLRDSIDQLDGREIIEAYIKSFDYGQMYFLREDIDDFCFRFGDAMEGFLEKGNLYAAFEIYESFKQKMAKRITWVNARLDENFDFSLDETFVPDRREADWANSEEESEDLWRRRLKYELLNEILSLASESNPDFDIENADLPDNNDEDRPFDPDKMLRLLKDPEFAKPIFDEARKKIRRRYERNLHLNEDRKATDVQESYINAMTQLFDPHSTFLSSDTLESFTSSIQNSFFGIGALLQDDDGICTIKELLPGGPAEASGKLSPEDKILGVAQGNEGLFEDVVDMQIRYIVRKIKGKKNTVVRLLIRPVNAADPSIRKEVSIVRDEVKLTANLATAKLINVPSGDRIIQVGVVELPSFYGNIGTGDTLMNASEDIAELLDKLRNAGAEGIVLDLRMNGGGLLREAVRVAGLFIPVGPVVQVRNKNGHTKILSDHDPRVLWDGPLIVLTSRFSASASEIVAGALQDYGRALIVGNSSTHGKGTAQEIYNMSTRGALPFIGKIKPTRPVATKITIKQFYLPGGSSTQLKGVPSDIVLPSVNEFLPIGNSDLPHALPWNKIKGLRLSTTTSRFSIDRVNKNGLKKALLNASKQRQKTLEEFSFLNEQIAWRKKRFDEKKISLNLKERIKRKILEQTYIKTLDETYEKLSQKNDKVQKFLTKVSEDLEAISRKNKKENGQKNDAGNIPSTEKEEDKPSYDIYLRESTRIMADWIRFNERNVTTITTHSSGYLQK